MQGAMLASAPASTSGQFVGGGVLDAPHLTSPLPDVYKRQGQHRWLAGIVLPAKRSRGRMQASAPTVEGDCLILKKGPACYYRQAP